MPLSPSKIRSRMDRLGILPADLARLVGMHPPHVSRLLSAKRHTNVRLDRAEAIAEALRCTVDDLLR